MIKKAIRMVLVFGVVFGAGYYFEEIKQTFQEMSPDDVVERTRGGDLNLQKEFLEAKSRFLDGKAEILDGKYEQARTELEETLRHLRKTMTMKGIEPSQELLTGVMEKIADLRQALGNGQEVATDTLRDTQEKLDALLDRAE